MKGKVTHRVVVHKVSKADRTATISNNGTSIALDNRLDIGAVRQRQGTLAATKAGSDLQVGTVEVRIQLTEPGLRYGTAFVGDAGASVSGDDGLVVGAFRVSPNCALVAAEMLADAQVGAVELWIQLLESCNTDGATTVRNDLTGVSLNHLLAVGAVGPGNHYTSSRHSASGNNNGDGCRQKRGLDHGVLDSSTQAERDAE